MTPTPERTEKTPRTERALCRIDDNGLRVMNLAGYGPVVRADFARQLETELNQANAQNEALRGALDELLAWSDTMRVAYEHPFLNDTAIHNARKTLSTTPAKA